MSESSASHRLTLAFLQDEPVRFWIVVIFFFLIMKRQKENVTKKNIEFIKLNLYYFSPRLNDVQDVQDLARLQEESKSNTSSCPFTTLSACHFVIFS